MQGGTSDDDERYIGERAIRERRTAAVAAVMGRLPSGPTTGLVAFSSIPDELLDQVVLLCEGKLAAVVLQLHHTVESALRPGISGEPEVELAVLEDAKRVVG